MLGIIWPGIAAFGVASIVALLAERKAALTSSGVVAAIAVGGMIVAIGGWAWGALLVLFFVTSSALSLVRRTRQESSRVVVRGYRRDAVQVLANGGVATLFAVLSGLSNSPLVFAGFVGALATANADTWATEIGRMARRPPRLITSGRRVPAGTSGGVSSLGTLGGLLGSMLIGLCAGGMIATGWVSHAADATIVISAAAFGGVLGMLFDSVVGATIQLLYRCPNCETTTERLIHDCGTATVRIRGWNGMNNDTVNGLATLVGALITIGIVAIL